jgi:hypothetical protein
VPVEIRFQPLARVGLTATDEFVSLDWDDGSLGRLKFCVDVRAVKYFALEHQSPVNDSFG